jgi:hypothetical protein
MQLSMQIGRGERGIPLRVSVLLQVVAVILLRDSRRSVAAVDFFAGGKRSSARRRSRSCINASGSLERGGGA